MLDFCSTFGAYSILYIFDGSRGIFDGFWSFSECWDEIKFWYIAGCVADDAARRHSKP